MEQTSLESKVVRIEHFELDEETDRVGLIDVRHWLRRGGDVVNTIDVRLFFVRIDIPLDQLMAAAINQSLDLLASAGQRGWLTDKSHRVGESHPEWFRQ